MMESSRGGNLSQGNSDSDSYDSDYKLDDSSESTSENLEYTSSESLSEEAQAELNLLKQNGEDLLQRIKELKISLAEANKEIVKKDDDAIKTRRTLERLRSSIRRKFEKGITEKKDESVPEKQEAQAILTEQIWVNILEKVVDFKTLFSCMNTCKLFDRLLLPTKTSWMFGNVFRHLYHHLQTQDVLKCRLVSRGWKTGVDNYFANPPCILATDLDETNPTRPPFVNPLLNNDLENCYVFNNEIDDFNVIGGPFHKMMKRHKSNPFLGRAATFVFVGKSNLYEMVRSDHWFWKALKKFLRFYGHHLWHLILSMRTYKWSSFNSRKTIQFLTKDVANLLPNLKTLRITGTLRFGIEIEALNIPSILPNLETLQIDDSHQAVEGCHQLFLCLLRSYQKQLKRLHVKSREWVEVFNLNWDSLNELHLEDIKNEEDLNVLNEMNIPTLEKIGIGYSSQIDNGFDKVLKIVNRLCKTSKLKTLRLPGGIDPKFVKSKAYAHPNLKTIEMGHCAFENSVNCYSFLVQFPFLENLNIYWSEPTSDENKWRYRGEIKFRIDGQFGEVNYEYYEDLEREEAQKELLETLDKEIIEVNKWVYNGKMYNSNIWEVLPKLKVFTFQNDVYTRNEYECSQRRGNNYS